jgi:FKBP-type peptidyl-prolyl cis-trans isomerase FkpA
MRKASFFLGLIVFFKTALAQGNLNSTKYNRASDGTEYIIYPAPNAAKIVGGNFFEMNVLAKYKDSILFNSIEEGMPQYIKYDTTQFPQVYKEIFKNINLGDSIVIRSLTDSLMAKGETAPFMEAGQYIYQCYTIAHVYNAQQQADSAQKAHVAVATERANKKYAANMEKNLLVNKTQLEKDGKTIEAYLAQKSITAVKTKWGTYISILKKGIGANAGTNDIVKVNYTGKTLLGKVVDSNTDPRFKHVRPLDVNLSVKGSVIPGWEEALLYLNKGSKAVFYIPSTLAYGAAGGGGDIGPNEILIFDIDVLSVKAATETPKHKAATGPVKMIPKTKTKKAVK